MHPSPSVIVTIEVKAIGFDNFSNYIISKILISTTKINTMVLESILRNSRDFFSKIAFSHPACTK